MFKFYFKIDETNFASSLHKSSICFISIFFLLISCAIKMHVVKCVCVCVSRGNS